MSRMASQITAVAITSKLRVIGFWRGNSPVTGEFPRQKDQ